jgi:membrane-bound lytic murein transglycosylase B
MTRLLPLLLFLTTVAHAGSYAERPEALAFIAEMESRHGFDGDHLRALFRHASPNASVLKAIRPPADPGARSWQAYRKRFVEPRRITAGHAFWREHGAALTRARALYGVPEEIIAAIIGVETIYGRHTGKFQVLEALATLAFDYPPRADLFRRELEALLLLARDEDRSPLSYRGSYAGAIGLPQFLPSSIRSYAIDFDANGRTDLAESPADAIGSVARFLQEHGWQPGEPVAVPVQVGSDVAPLIEEGIKPRRLPAEMRPFGVRTEGLPERPAALIDLATPNAPVEYWLGYENFYVLTRYNRSSFYAMAVFQLAEALRAGRP